MVTTADADIINDSLDEGFRTPYDLVKYYIVKNNNNGYYLKEIKDYCKNEYLSDGKARTKESINAKDPSKITINDIAYLYTDAADEQRGPLLAVARAGEC